MCGTGVLGMAGDVTRHISSFFGVSQFELRLLAVFVMLACKLECCLSNCVSWHTLSCMLNPLQSSFNQAAQFKGDLRHHTKPGVKGGSCLVQQHAQTVDGAVATLPGGSEQGRFKRYVDHVRH